MSYDSCWTLAGPVSRRGIGLHSGEINEVCLLPSSQRGFFLSWMGSQEPPTQIALENFRQTPLCTTLEIGQNKLATVEHLFAAIAGCGITNVEIRVSGEEVPLLDGSAIDWVRGIADTGIKPVSMDGFRQMVLKKPLLVCRGDSVITATPAEKFSLIGLIDFPHKAIGVQTFSIELDPHCFVKEIAPARTFGFRDQVDQLRQVGLIKGGGLDNALVCDGDHWMNPPLRFPDEPIRHKLLDLIGDLAIVGFPKAQILVYKGSHALHLDLAAALLNTFSTPSVIS